VSSATEPGRPRWWESAGRTGRSHGPFGLKGLALNLTFREADAGQGLRDGPEAPRDLLVAGGIEVTYEETDVVHTIDRAVLPLAADWLAATVPAKG